MSAAATTSGPQLADRLRTIRVGVRQDLETSRHLFWGRPSYVIRDPITFQSQRLDPADYEVFASIDPERPLGAIFDGLVRQGKVGRDDQERFYRFVMTLHGLAFLHLPISDDKLLYRRYCLKEEARRKERLMSILFLRIPVWNPNAFLDRTIRFARPLFGWPFFVFWLLLMGAAGVTAASRWDELFQPLQGLLAARNIPLMWATLVGLKVFHEFGHAYACKHYGGHVPEMGIYLVVFTPCAYMDATASWGFSRKWERMVVCLGGMYVESVVAALAVFVWAATGPSFLNAVAYQIIFLASAVTVLFNINPLMRYDGYYLASDLLQVPNLRQRARAYMMDVMKRVALGLPATVVPAGRRMRVILMSYGLAATVYRALLLITIAALLASKVFIVGAVMAVAYVGGTVVSMGRRTMRYLWFADETARVRRRAVLVGVAGMVILPALAVLIPLPGNVHAAGVLTTREETVVRAASGGFLLRAAAKSGDSVRAGDPLVELTSDEWDETQAVARTNLRSARLRHDAFLLAAPHRAMEEQTRAELYEANLDYSVSRRADLVVRAPQAGRVVHCLHVRDQGRFLPPGSTIAMIAAGPWQVRAFLTEDQMAAASPVVGGPAEFRAAACPQRTFSGVIRQVAPSGSKRIEPAALTHVGGGDIPVDPASGIAGKPYFEVVVELAIEDAPELRHGTTGRVRLSGRAEPVVTSITRRLLRFWDKLVQE